LAENLALFQGKTLSCNWRIASRRAPGLFSYGIFRKAGITVAVIGMSHRRPEKNFAPGALAGLVRLDVLKEFSRFMPELMKEKPHLILLAMHEGLPGEGKGTHSRRSFAGSLLRKWPQIDLVLGGHTHQVSPGKKSYSGQWCVQAPPLAEGIGVVDAEVDPGSGRLLSLRSHIRKSRRGERDPQTEKLLEEKNFFCKKEGERRIGTLPFAPAPAGRLLSAAANGPFSLLLGNAVREAAGTPIAFLGYGGKYRCRSGEITKRRLFLLLPYETTVSCLPLTPEECRQIIEEQCRNSRSGNFQTPSGIRYTFEGGKVGKELYDENGVLWESGERLAAFSAFVLAGASEHFPVLASVAERKRALMTDLPLTVREAAERYIGKHYGDRENAFRRKDRKK
ncbi:MAG: 5'-nucleotidase C-terminal domain-containing protein, partial [Lentisphaeria bacterium]|nr:5'-nucleotidase C-terminal domain-containing protein [Lentisphaeria bacterium]